MKLFLDCGRTRKAFSSSLQGFDPGFTLQASRYREKAATIRVSMRVGTMIFKAKPSVRTSHFFISYLLWENGSVLLIDPAHDRIMEDSKE